MQTGRTRGGPDVAPDASIGKYLTRATNNSAGEVEHRNVRVLTGFPANENSPEPFNVELSPSNRIASLWQVHHGAVAAL
jgi:hypothetical protein